MFGYCCKWFQYICYKGEIVSSFPIYRKSLQNNAKLFTLIPKYFKAKQQGGLISLPLYIVMQ